VLGLVLAFVERVAYMVLFLLLRSGHLEEIGALSIVVGDYAQVACYLRLYKIVYPKESSIRRGLCTRKPQTYILTFTKLFTRLDSHQ